MTESKNVEAMVARAQAGDRDALAEVVRAMQDRVFHLALRMLGSAEDARDASQEILVRMVTKLGSFRGESSFTTWVHRLAVHALINTKVSLRRRESHFDELGESLDAAVAASAGMTLAPEHAALIDEAKQVCVQGMLLCLDRPHRVAYILGEILELGGDEAAAILEISHAAYRKRLSRARADMDAFFAGHCGLANPDNACRCRRLLPLAIAGGIVDPAAPPFARLPVVREDRLRVDIERLRSGAEIVRGLPQHGSPEDFALGIRTLLRGFDDAN
ncbi:MAG: RNA polymerase sigma factor [Nannocystaceae bacterium]